VQNIGTNLDLFQLQISQLIHRKGFKRSMEERDGMQPLQDRNDGLAIDQETREE
jgi:hypothetical protein